MTATVREKIMAALVAAFEAVVEGEPANDPYLFSWGLVTRAELPADAARKHYAIGIYDVTETMTPAVGVYYAEIEVVLEWKAMVDLEEEPGVVGNKVIGEIKRVLRKDLSLGGNALNTVMVSNTLSIDGEEDRQIGGTCDVVVRYRHSENDPRKLA